MNSLHLRRFQTHERLNLTLSSDGVTVIAGRSGSGKTSVIRALSWMALCRGTGKSLVSRDGDSGQMQVRLSGGFLEQEISREFDGSASTYTIDGRTLRATGTRVPEEVFDALRLDADNFQMQHSPLFWISETPGKLAQAIGVLSGTEKVSSAAKRVRTSITSLNAGIKQVSATLESLKQNLARYDVEETTKLLDATEALTKALNGLTKINKGISKYRSKMKTVCQLDQGREHAHTEALNAHHALTTFVDFRARSAAVETALSNMERLQSCLGRIVETSSLVKRLKKEHSRAERRLQKHQSQKPSQTKESGVGSVCPNCGMALP